MVLRRSLPAAFAVAALAATGSGSPRLVFYALLAAVPSAGVAALAAYGDALEGLCGGVRPLLCGLALALLVVAAAERGTAICGSALVGCLALYALQALATVLAGPVRA